MLMLHGDMRTARSWDAVARDLCRRFHILSLDARGHGDSEWTERGYRFDNRVEDLKAFCEHVGLSNMIAVGHSTGGVIMTKLADSHPGFFNRLVLLEPMVVVDENFQRMVSRRPDARRRTWNNREELHAYLKQHGIAGRWRDDVIRDVVEHEALELPDGKIDMKWAPDSMNWEERRGDYHDLKPIFRNLSLPMLYIMSEQRVSIFRDLPALAAELPNFHLTTIRRTGHNMYMERPDAVSSLITTFVDDKAVPEII